MFRKYLGYTLFSLGLLGVWVFSAEAAIFPRNLRIGDRGEDVYGLQVILNQSPTTRVAFTGPGSPGQETDYFGALTAAAVKRYQEANATEILFPLGLSLGTGFVGPLTRTHLETGGTRAYISNPLELVLMVAGEENKKVDTGVFLNKPFSEALIGSVEAIEEAGGKPEVAAESFSPNPAAIQTCAILSLILPLAQTPMFMHVCIMFYDELFKDLAEDLGVDGGGFGGGGDSQSDIAEKVKDFIKKQLENGCSL